MNFVKLYIGDYLRDTGTLTLAQHGAYSLMLLEHYATERPLPMGRELHRLLRAENKAERDAIDFVATKYWREECGGLVNTRAEKEISRATHQREVNQAIGKLGGRPKRTEQEPEPRTESVSDGETDTATESVSEPEPNRNPNQTPDTRQPENKGEPVFTGPQRARPPDDPEPPPEAAGHAPTPAGSVCRSMRQAGLAAVNPGDPRLLALLAQGITEAELVGVAVEAVAGGKGWAWVLHVVAARRREAAAIAVAPGGPPKQRGPAAPNTTVPSDAAERTAAMLREQAGRVAIAPSPETLARLKAVRSAAA